MSGIFASQRVQPWHVGRAGPEDEMLDLAYRNSENNLNIPVPSQPFLRAHGDCFAVHRDVQLLPQQCGRGILVGQPKVNWLVAGDIRIGEEVACLVADLIHQVEASHNNNVHLLISNPLCATRCSRNVKSHSRISSMPHSAGSRHERSYSLLSPMSPSGRVCTQGPLTAQNSCHLCKSSCMFVLLCSDLTETVCLQQANANARRCAKIRVAQCIVGARKRCANLQQPAA